MQVTKEQASEGCTQYAQGGVSAVLAELDSIESHISDTLRAGDFINDLRYDWHPRFSVSLLVTQRSLLEKLPATLSNRTELAICVGLLKSSAEKAQQRSSSSPSLEPSSHEAGMALST